MSDTPRTDVETVPLRDAGAWDEYVSSDFARSLERELERKENERLRERINRLHSALTPFAKVGEVLTRFMENYPDGKRGVLWCSENASIRAEDCRTAFTVLNKKLQ